MFLKAIQALFVISVVIAFSGCGSDSGSGLGNSLSNLSQIPSADQMVSGNGTNGITLKNQGLTHILGINLQSVQGTPPILKTSINSASNVDTYYFNGLVAAITAAQTATAAQKNQFWGNDTTTPGPSGAGGCWMAFRVLDSFRRMLSAASTMCYMKGIVSAASGVTATGNDTVATAFTQGASDKMVKVAVKNFPQQGEGGPGSDFGVYFKIYGTNTVTGDVYSYLMCMYNSGAVVNKESLTVNKVTGEYTATQFDKWGGAQNTGQNIVTAKLKSDASGNIVFDPAADRTAVSTYTGTWGRFASKVSINSLDQIFSRAYSQSNWGTDKNFSVSAYTGNTMADLRFLQAAYVGHSQSNYGNHSYDGALEYRNTFYAAVETSDLTTHTSGYSFASDSFFTSLPDTTFDSTGCDNNVTADTTITMDFSDAAILSIRNTCDSHDDGMSSNACNSSEIQAAQQYVYN